jgi:hypothetical protein
MSQYRNTLVPLLSSDIMSCCLTEACCWCGRSSYLTSRIRYLLMETLNKSCFQERNATRHLRADASPELCVHTGRVWCWESATASRRVAFPASRRICIPGRVSIALTNQLTN